MSRAAAVLQAHSEHAVEHQSQEIDQGMGANPVRAEVKDRLLLGQCRLQYAASFMLQIQGTPQ